MTFFCIMNPAHALSCSLYNTSSLYLGDALRSLCDLHLLYILNMYLEINTLCHVIIIIINIIISLLLFVSLY